MFTVELLCKPYVKRFLQINCGEPADLTQHKQLQSDFKKFLRRPCDKYEARYQKFSFTTHTESIRIIISDDDFNRHGWELTVTDTVAFGKCVERHAKFMMRNFIGGYAMVMELKTAILRFQEEIGYYENIWKYESILKDLQRNQREKVDISKEIIEQIKKITLGNLSRLGTLSPQAMKYYEDAK